jgi:hypothetical protein
MSGLKFAEVMRGHIAFDDRGFERAGREGRRNDARLNARLTIDVSDLDAFVADPEREAMVTGWIECDALGGRLAIERGVFSPFVANHDPRQTLMLYRLWFRDSVGHPLTLAGFKSLPGGAATRVWRDTTVLFVRVLSGHGESPVEVVASGIIRVRAADFLATLASFRGRADTFPDQAKAIARYGAFFAGQVWPLYAPKFGSKRPSPDPDPDSETGNK